MSEQDSDGKREKRANGSHLIAATLCVVLFLLVGRGPSEEAGRGALDQAGLAKTVWGKAEDWQARSAAVKGLTDQALLTRIAVEHWDGTIRASAVAKLTDEVLLAKLALEDKDSTVRGAAVGKLFDQGTLAKVALKDKDSTVRQRAVEKLTDETTLATVAVTDEFASVRRAAVNKLTDQALLARVAVEDEDIDIRRDATQKLTDETLLARMGMWVKPELTRQVGEQTLLVKIAVEAKDSEVRCAAVEKLDNQAVLAKVAVDDLVSQVRFVATKKLTDQATLAKVAVKDWDPAVRRAAIENLTDQAALVEIAIREKSLDVRLAAIGKVTDQALLCQWVEKEPQAAVRQAAAARIAEDEFLLKRLPTESSAAVRNVMIEALREKDSLRQVSLTAYYQEDREHALRRLQEALQDPASDVVIAREALQRRVKELADENDNSRLLTLAQEGEFDVLRTAAAKRLNDWAALEQAACRITNRDVLKILLVKLNNGPVLNRVAARAADPAMRLAASIMLGDKSWVQIFDAATARGATVQMLGDALSAVSLFPDVQEDAKMAVQRACLNLIRRGDESRIPEMADLLEGYGDKTLAEDYLNCGQPDLDATARGWAQRRGYDVGIGAGSHRANWGVSGR